MGSIGVRWIRISTYTITALLLTFEKAGTTKLLLLPLFRDPIMHSLQSLDLHQSINQSVQVSMIHEVQWTVQCYDILIQLNTYQYIFNLMQYIF